MEDKTAKPQSFNQWLRQQLQRDDAVGDIARDARDDQTWPDAQRLQTYQEHLENFPASPNALKALETAWNEFAALQRQAQKAPGRNITIRLYNVREDGLPDFEANPGLIGKVAFISGGAVVAGRPVDRYSHKWETDPALNPPGVLNHHTGVSTWLEFPFCIWSEDLLEEYE